MNEKQNISTRQAVRKDLIQYGRIANVPAGMSEAEIQEAYGDDLKKGLIKRLVSDPGRSESDLREGEQIDPATGRVKAPSGSDRVWNAGPATTQVFADLAVAVRTNYVSGARSGPCILEHLTFIVPAFTVAGWALNFVGVHISRTPNVGPFQGELTVFESFDPGDLLGSPVGAMQTIFDTAMATAVGVRPLSKFDYFPKLVIPFDRFFISVSVDQASSTGILQTICDFGPIDIPRAKLSQTVSVEPRLVRAAPGVAAPAAALISREQLFHNYGEIKTLEALGNRIVWATVRMTGRGDFPIAVTVVSKG